MRGMAAWSRPLGTNTSLSKRLLSTQRWFATDQFKWAVLARHKAIPLRRSKRGAEVLPLSGM